MKAAVISLGSESSQMLVSSLSKYFDVVDELDLKQIEIVLEAGKPQVMHSGIVLKRYDCVYLRGSFKYAQVLSAISSALSGEAYTPIKPYTFSIGHDKFLTQLVLQKKGIPMPKAYLASTVEGAKAVLEKLRFPIIIKFPSGTHGKGVLISDSYASASSMLDALFVMNKSFIIQEYIETGGVDIRVIVAGEKVVASMKRIAVQDEKRANIHMGAVGKPYTLDFRTQKIAVNAAKAVGADICAVDILEGPRGPMVIEVNLSPSFQGITKATKIDVADKVAAVLYSKAEDFMKSKSEGEEKGLLQSIDIGKKQEIAREVIAPITFRGNRMLLPEVATRISGFSEEKDYIIKFKGNTIVIENLRL
ncbi:RimK family alpha-L-glutamate ligase [Candidatus Woesearchaeota archaeon]|nr:RimK family alpha-L-glutamate ligase [Candidatus Woesearchaeota archaeon]